MSQAVKPAGVVGPVWVHSPFYCVKIYKWLGGVTFVKVFQHAQRRQVHEESLIFLYHAYLLLIHWVQLNVNFVSFI